MTVYHNIAIFALWKRKGHQIFVSTLWHYGCCFSLPTSRSRVQMLQRFLISFTAKLKNFIFFPKKGNFLGCLKVEHMQKIHIFKLFKRISLYAELFPGMWRTLTLIWQEKIATKSFCSNFPNLRECFSFHLRITYFSQFLRVFFQFAFALLPLFPLVQHLLTMNCPQWPNVFS